MNTSELIDKKDIKYPQLNVDIQFYDNEKMIQQRLQNIQNYENIRIFYNIHKERNYLINQYIKNQTQIKNFTIGINGRLLYEMNEIIQILKSIQSLVNLKKFSFKLFFQSKNIAIKDIGLEFGSTLKVLNNLNELELSIDNTQMLQQEGIQSVCDGITSLNLLTHLNLFLQFVSQSCNQKLLSLILNTINNLILLRTLKLTLYIQKSTEIFQFDLGFFTQNLTNLEEFSLEINNQAKCANNNFQSLISMLIEMKGLKKLNLKIYDIQLQSNQVSNLLNSLFWLENLEELDVNLNYYILNNDCMVIQNNLYLLSKLKKLSIDLDLLCLSRQQYVLFSEGIDHIPNLIELKLNLNNLVFGCSEEDKLIRLIENSLDLRVLKLIYSDPIDANIFNKIALSLTNLLGMEDLNLQIFVKESEVTTIIDIFEIISKLINLKHLTLNKIANFKGIPYYLHKLTQLKELYLDNINDNLINNNIIHIQQPQLILSQLTTLEISFNNEIQIQGLVQLGECFVHFQNLRFLTLKQHCSIPIDNQTEDILKLVSQIKNLTNLRQLYLQLQPTDNKQFLLELSTALQTLSHLNVMRAITYTYFFRQQLNTTIQRKAKRLVKLY